MTSYINKTYIISKIFQMKAANNNVIVLVAIVSDLLWSHEL